MTTIDTMEDALFVFIKDRTISDKEKLRELEEMLSLCKGAIKIIQRRGITSPEHMMLCLDEELEDKTNNVESVVYLDDVEGTDDITWGCTKCGNNWIAKTVIPCNVCYPETK